MIIPNRRLCVALRGSSSNTSLTILVQPAGWKFLQEYDELEDFVQLLFGWIMLNRGLGNVGCIKSTLVIGQCIDE